MEKYEAAVKFIGSIVILAGIIALFVAAFRIKSEDSWRKIAEKRLAALEDEEKEKEKWKRRAESAEIEVEKLTSRTARDRATIDRYESKYGYLQLPDDIHRSRG